MTDAGGTAGGVGILTRAFRGLREAPGMQPAALATGRATGALWNGGGMPGGLLAVSVYLQCSVGMDPGNRKILADLAVELRTCGSPYVVGGELFNAELVCPWSGRDKAAGTCRASLEIGERWISWFPRSCSAGCEGAGFCTMRRCGHTGRLRST